jgi:MFS superfamily sulfate permease-like transporter
MAGVILILLGVTGLGTAVKFIPRSVVIGFTNGIAVLIASTQIRDFFGLRLATVPGDFLGRAKVLVGYAGTASGAATALAAVTVVLLLVVYFLVILAALKLHGQDHSEGTFKAPSPLLVLGLVANLALAVYVVQDDPFSLVWCAGLIGVGLVLYAAERVFGRSASAVS